jgi:hypothetical protein
MNLETVSMVMDIEADTLCDPQEAVKERLAEA